MSSVAMKDYDNRLLGGSTRGGGAGRTSVGSGDDDYGGSSVLGTLASTLSQMAGVVSADMYSKMYGVSYQDAKTALANQSETAGTDTGVNYDPNADLNYEQYGVEASKIVNQDLRKFTMPTASAMNGWFQKVNSASPFNGNGQVFIDAGKDTGINPRYIAAHAALESGWGTSAIARKKNNYFGIGAFDSSPYASAYTFGNGLQNGIMGGSKWISDKYINNGYETLAKMKARGYATDPEWPFKIANIMKKAPKDPMYNDDGSLKSSGGLTASTVDLSGTGNLLGNTFAQKNTFASLANNGLSIGSGDDSYDGFTSSKSIEDKLNVALDADGVESKLDTLISVVKDIFNVAKEKKENQNIVNIGSGDTKVNVNTKGNGKKDRKSNIIVNKTKESTSSLRNMHELIARSSATPA